MGEVRAKKALGQHFLVDLNIARKICDSLSGGSAVGGPCTVLEVGCGMGVLTQFLLRRSDIVIWVYFWIWQYTRSLQKTMRHSTIQTIHITILFLQMG